MRPGELGHQPVHPAGFQRLSQLLNLRHGQARAGGAVALTPLHSFIQFRLSPGYVAVLSP
jgi:hypothetical protein